MRSISSCSSIERVHHYLVLLLLFYSVGCFRTPDIEKIECKAASDCPNDYVCLIEGDAYTGKCRKTTDAAILDGLSLKDSFGTNEKGQLDVP